MSGVLIRTETPVEYFKELVEAALRNQHIEAGVLTSHYVIQLLAGFVRPHVPDDGEGGDEALAMRLVRALESAGEHQRARLRRLGDMSLFLSGFFSDSLSRRVVDVDYYVALGGYAYASLSRSEETFWADVFGELAEKFVAFVDVLSEVSDRTSVTSNRDLLRMYERWLRTGSRRSGDLLVERGIVPNRSIGTKFIQ